MNFIKTAIFLFCGGRFTGAAADHKHLLDDGPLDSTSSSLHHSGHETITKLLCVDTKERCSSDQGTLGLLQHTATTWNIQQVFEKSQFTVYSHHFISTIVERVVCVAVQQIHHSIACILLGKKVMHSSILWKIKHILVFVITIRNKLWTTQFY